MASKTLRPHQSEALDDVRRAFREGHKRVMVQAVTGFGKTVLATSIIKGAVQKGRRSMFVVPSISLIDQTVDRFAEDGIDDVGVIQAQHELTDHRRPIQIASVQTLLNRSLEETAQVVSRRRSVYVKENGVIQQVPGKDKDGNDVMVDQRVTIDKDVKLMPIPLPDLIVIDEGHVFFNIYEEMMNHPRWKDIPVIGLSATPWTRGLGKHYSKLVITKPMVELIEEKYLSDFRVFAPTTPDLSNVSISKTTGDYNEEESEKEMQKLTADIVENWILKGEGRPTLCFCVNRKHAKELQERFVANGVKAGYIDAFTEKEERRELQRQFAARELDVICNVGVLTTGVDWDVRCIILARPTKSEMLFCQIIGRGLRTADGKDYCLIFDHSDNHQRLGFVTDLGVTELHNGQRKIASVRETEEALPKECPKCKFMRPVKTPICPNCGFKPEVKSKIECDDGELEEMVRKASTVKKREYSMEEKQTWYSMLMWIANNRGRAKGWISNTYHDKFGVWPRGMSETPMAPSREVTDYVVHKDIKFKHSRSKERGGASLFPVHSKNYRW